MDKTSRHLVIALGGFALVLWYFGIGEAELVLLALCSLAIAVRAWRAATARGAVSG